jgi:ubiquinone/menaquinone biosynthesis C-methylase UbiE
MTLTWPEDWGPSIRDELEVMARCRSLAGVRVLEVGCGKARTARALLQRHPDAEVVGIEPHAALVTGNQSRPQAGLTVMAGRGEALPFEDASFDMVWLLKSLHHIADPDAALAEALRVLSPGAWLYVSEPVYEGDLNALVRLYNDEGVVRAQAQKALDRLVTDFNLQEVRHTFVQPVHFADADDFVHRMMGEALAKLQDAAAAQALTQQVRSAYAPHQSAAGAHFVRPMLARAFCKS